MISEKYEEANRIVDEADEWLRDEKNWGDAAGIERQERRRHAAIITMADEYNQWTDGFQRLQPVADIGGMYNRLEIVNASRSVPYKEAGNVQ